MSFPRAHKYGSSRMTTDGYSFASKLEAALYCQLKLEMRAGLYDAIKVQDHVKLSDAEIVYIADFRTTKDGIDLWHEAKGFETPEWRLKRRLWKAYGPGKLRVYKGSSNRIYLHEELEGK